jgi:hypothetical protein
MASTCNKCQRLPSLASMAANLWWVQIPLCMQCSVHHTVNATGKLDHLFTESDTPLNLSRSLALASSTAPGSLPFPVTLGLLKVSAVRLLLGTNWSASWSSRAEARSYASQTQYNNKLKRMYPGIATLITAMKMSYEHNYLTTRPCT